MVEAGTDGALIEAEYLHDVLDEALVEQLLRHLVQMLTAAVAAPDKTVGELDMLGADDQAWLDAVSRGPDFAPPPEAPATLGSLVADRAAATPNAIAVVDDHGRYSYAEINARANRIAHHLIAAGIGTEDKVAVLFGRSTELVVTALGIAKAGAAYVPVDPEYPPDRIEFILGDARPSIVLREPLTDDELAGRPDTDPTDADRVRPLRAENLAYLIYTSGSTGLPKGVEVSHAPITEYLVWFGGEYGIDDTDVLLQVASPSFDVSIGELFGTLGNGARLVIPRPDGLRDIGYLTDLLQREGVTAMHFVPSLLGLFLSLPGVNQWRTLRRIPIGGEPLPGELADKFHATFDALLHNFYGPTETVVNSSRHKVEGPQGNRIVPIGSPNINTTMWLLDDALQPVPVGVIGEIYIGGTHVARGYFDRPGLTAERFVADPWTPGQRLYRTGDLARRNAAGDLEFIGRADDQVKVRGFRIELGEVASAISVDPSVGQCVVVLSDLPGLGRSLVAYLTPPPRAPGRLRRDSADPGPGGRGLAGIHGTGGLRGGRRHPDHRARQDRPRRAARPAASRARPTGSRRPTPNTWWRNCSPNCSPVTRWAPTTRSSTSAATRCWPPNWSPRSAPAARWRSASGRSSRPARWPDWPPRSTGPRPRNPTGPGDRRWSRCRAPATSRSRRRSCEPGSPTDWTPVPPATTFR